MMFKKVRTSSQIGLLDIYIYMCVIKFNSCCHFLIKEIAKDEHDMEKETELRKQLTEMEEKASELERKRTENISVMA